MINLLEHLYIHRKKRALDSRQQYEKTRSALLELLGSICCICGFSDKRALQIDHKYGHGKKEINSYSNLQSMYRYYVKHPIFAINNLQILCANCNWIKRHKNNEDNKRLY